ncbi:sensor histidine kinase [Paenibacillus sp. TRM 82003]|nr:sensor histidine kinase [Paenibacillus sp. TRM 82003]
MKAFYSNLRIKYKMFVLITSVMLLVSLSSAALLQYVFQVYDREIYAKASQALNLSAFGVENELRRMERVTFRIDTDPLIQTYLYNVKNEPSNYRLYITASDLTERMWELGGIEEYVSSLHMFDIDDFEYRTGTNIVKTPPPRILDIRRETSYGAGSHTWIYPDEADRALVAAREVRYHLNLTFERVGMMAIRVNLSKIVADYARGMSEEGAYFLIVKDRQLMYPSALPFEHDGLLDTVGKTDGYRVAELDGKRYFMTVATSDYMPWSYVMLMPYEQLFQTVEAVKRLALIVFSSLFLLSLFVSMRFARNVTGPIESLNAKMKNVQKGNFLVADEPSERSFPMDEAGQLHRNFRIMLQRIDELITENYRKQLAIKDSEFKALQSQINPHFLYNTLESINWSAKASGQQDISNMVESLGYLLRSAINHKDPLIPLREEMSIVQHYLTIQKVRFEERLDFETDIPPELGRYIIPKLSLQPIVENAIHYGLERMIEPCRIRVRARLDGDQLELTVDDNGPGMDAKTMELWRRGELRTRGAGVGLRNIDERIRLMFGEEYGLTLHSEPKTGTRVTVRLPHDAKG